MLKVQGLGYKRKVRGTGFKVHGHELRTVRCTLFRFEQATRSIALNDLTAIGAVTAAVSMGYRVPEDISIVGFDNTEIAKYCNPPLTTVNIPTVRQGEIATNMLLELIENRQAEPYSVELHPELIIRKTVSRAKP